MVSRSVASQLALQGVPPRKASLVRGQSSAGERRDDGSFGAQDQSAEGGLVEASARAAANSSSVQPPSGPMARTAVLDWHSASFENLRESDGASADSESITRTFADCDAKALRGLASASRSGTRTRRDCCEASRRIFFQRCGALRCRREQRFLTASRRQRHDSAHAQVRSLFRWPIRTRQISRWRAAAWFRGCGL